MQVWKRMGLHHGRVVRSFIHSDVADRPDYVNLSVNLSVNLARDH